MNDFRFGRILNFLEKWADYHEVETVSNLNHFVKKSWTDFPKDVNRFLGWTGFFFKQFSKDELINTGWLPWMDFHAEQISIMKISITWMDFNYEMVSSFNNFHLWTNLKIYEVPRGTFLKNEKDYHLEQQILKNELFFPNIGYMNGYWWWTNCKHERFSSLNNFQQMIGFHRVGYMNGYRWWTKIAKSMNGFFSLNNFRGWTDLKMYEDPHWTFLNLETILLHEWISTTDRFPLEHSYYMNEFHLWTVSVLEQFWKWTHCHLGFFFLKNERITTLNIFQLKQFWKHEPIFQKRHEQISMMNGFLL
jgi:hypothetical protein